MSDPSPPRHTAKRTAALSATRPQEVVFRGKVYGTLDDMPTKERKAYEQVLRTLENAIPSGAPDTWEEVARS
jgi:hypothetical protein